MRVTFTKVDDKRYSVAIERELGPPLVPRFAPGHDDLMPHDIAHYLVEEHYGIQLGVWGQLAAGGGGLFRPAPEDNTLQVRRRVQRIAALGRKDMARSEELVVLTVAAWECTIGRAKHQPGTHLVPPDGEALDGAVRRMGEVAHQWQALTHGQSLTFTWPAHLTFDAARSHRGRRTTRRTPSRARR